MLIIGAKGFAKEVLQVFHQLNQLEGVGFYDDVNEDIGEFLYDVFPILKNQTEVKEFFLKNGNEFTIGIGNPQLRYELYMKFKNLGGSFCTTISPKSEIGNYDINIGYGSNILSNAIFSNSVKIGRGCIVYYNVVVTHNCIIKEFVELSPNVILLGNVEVGAFSHIGASTTVLPKVKIGSNVIIGAGSIVTKDIPDNCLAYGTPAKVIKKLEPFKF
jgi:sugar O-acyltransferase (sialic acid O-acetyltransferase NeuD family)